MLSFLKRIFSKGYEFPCKDCSSKQTCDTACHKIELDNSKLGEICFSGNCCPDCGSTRCHFGPMGGMSQNIQCCDCGHYFNICPAIDRCERICFRDGKFLPGFSD